MGWQWVIQHDDDVQLEGGFTTSRAARVDLWRTMDARGWGHPDLRDLRRYAEWRAVCELEKVLGTDGAFSIISKHFAVSVTPEGEWIPATVIMSLNWGE